MNRLFLALIALGGVSALSPAQAQVQPSAQQCLNREDGSSLCVNDRILDDRNLKGTLTQIYSDFTGVVAFDSGDTNLIDLQYASREVSCIYGFCAGDAVSNEESGDGRITDVFENGVAEVNFYNDDDGQLDYVEINSLSAIENDSIAVSYPWAAPRPFPDTTIYSYQFYAPPIRPVYFYPVGYAHPRTIVGGILRAIFPPPPVYFGYHPYNPYPYRYSPSVQWGFHARVRAPGFNLHIGIPPRPQNYGPRPGIGNGYHGGGRPGGVIVGNGGFGGGYGRPPVVVRPPVRIPPPQQNIPGPYHPPGAGHGGGFGGNGGGFNGPRGPAGPGGGSRGGPGRH